MKQLVAPGVHGPWPLESPPNINNNSAFIVLSLLMIVRRVLPRTIHRCARVVHHSPFLHAQISCIMQSSDLHHLQSRDTPTKAKDTNPRTKRYPLFTCLIRKLSLHFRTWDKLLRAWLSVIERQKSKVDCRLSRFSKCQLWRGLHR